MLPLEIFVLARIFLQKISCVHEFFSDLTKIFVLTRIFFVLYTVLLLFFNLQHSTLQTACVGCEYRLKIAKF